MPRHGPLDGPTIKAALYLGFGLTLGLWLVAGYHFTRRVASVQRDAEEIGRRYMQAQERLSSVRVQVLLGSVYVRDALLDSNPGTAGEYRRQLLESYRTIDETLGDYVPVLDSADERTRVARLRREIDDFRTTMLEVLGGQGRPDTRLLLRTRIVPKRESVIRVADEVQALNRAGFVEQQRQIAEVYREGQRQLWRQLGLALAASVGIGLFATIYAGRLEDRLRRQMARDVENARDLQRLSRQLINAQEEERRSIARELHDEIGQVLTAIKVELSLAQRAIEAAGGAPDTLKGIRSITDGALQSVRDLSHLLHPGLLDDLGLPATIDWYLRGFGKRHGIAVDLVHERMDDRLVPEIEASAYRIVQEALTNVAKHAQATRCRVYLQRLATTVLITVEDDGVGFDPEETHELGRRGLGLVSVRERVSQLRGTIRLETAPGKGTRLTVELPAPPRDPVHAADPADPVAAPPQTELARG